MTSGEGPSQNTQPTWRITHVRPHESGVSVVAVNPNGSEVASGSILNATVYIWDVNTGNQIRVLKGLKGGVQALAYSPDGQFLAVGRGMVTSSEVSVHVFRAGTDALVQQLDPPHIVTRDAPKGVSGVKSVHYSPDGQYLAVGFEGGAIGFYEARTGTLIRSFPTPGALHGPIAYSPNGQCLAISERIKTEEDVFAHHVIHLINVNAGDIVKTFSGHTDLVTALAFSPDGKYLISGSNTGSMRGTVDKKRNQGVERRNEDPIRIWNIETAAIEKEFAGHTSSVRSLMFTDSGQTLVSGSYDGTIKMWNVKKGTLDVTLTGHHDPIDSVAATSDSKHLFSGGGANLTVWVR